jgi:hypothetical protein
MRETFLPYLSFCERRLRPLIPAFLWNWIIQFEAVNWIYCCRHREVQVAPGWERFLDRINETLSTSDEEDEFVFEGIHVLVKPAWKWMLGN